MNLRVALPAHDFSSSTSTKRNGRHRVGDRFDMLRKGGNDAGRRDASVGGVRFQCRKDLELLSAVFVLAFVDGLKKRLLSCQ